MTNDYFPYNENIKIINSTKDPQIGMEEFWIWLIGNFKLNYVSYLLFLQITSVSILYYNIKLLNPQKLILFLGIWIMVCMINLIGLRAFLFYMLFYMSIILRSKGKKILSLLILCISAFIHKTAIIAVPLYFLTMLPLTFYRMKLITSLFLLSAVLIKILISSQLDVLYDYLTNFGVPGAIYITYEENANATGNVIWKILPVISRIILFILVALSIIRSPRSLYCNSIIYRTQYNLLFWSSIIALSLFLIDLPDPSVANRTFTIGVIIALPYILSELSNHNSLKKQDKHVITLLFLLYFIVSDILISRVALINHVFDINNS